MLAFNHISYVDFILGGLAAQPSKRLVRFMAKRELFDHKISGPIMRSLHHINVDREDGMGSYETALDYLAAGEVVGLFPEATISRSFELKDFKSGTVRMAWQAQVPLIPVILWGTQRIYTKDHPKDFSRGKAIRISVGEPVALDRVAQPRHRAAAQADDRAPRRVDPHLPAARGGCLVGAGVVRRQRPDPRAGQHDRAGRVAGPGREAPSRAAGRPRRRGPPQAIGALAVDAPGTS